MTRSALSALTGEFLFVTPIKLIKYKCNQQKEAYG